MGNVNLDFNIWLNVKNMPKRTFKQALIDTYSYRQLLTDYQNLIDIWFDPDEVDWETQSSIFAHYGIGSFDLWFDPGKFVFNEKAIKALIHKASTKKNFDKWRKHCDVDIFKHSYELTIYATTIIEKWWDPEKYNWIYSRLLVEYSSSRDIDIWYNPDKLNWDWILQIEDHRAAVFAIRDIRLKYLNHEQMLHELNCVELEHKLKAEGCQV